MTQLSGRIIMTKNASNIDEWGNAHTLGYCAQSPWLQNESIKDNILFGSPFDADRYKQVIQCCALEPDLDMLEDGDATEIGAKGVSLSGGQKARSVFEVVRVATQLIISGGLLLRGLVMRAQDMFCLMIP
jgi:ABC-type bacteriocin/lantibiotic exporter with double-glycine peptidase domain